MAGDMTSKTKKASAGRAARYFVDFDHTLLRSNSTQELLRLARPFALIWPIFIAISLVMKVFGVRRRTRMIWEDALKVRVLRLLNPRVLRRLDETGPNIAEQRLNADVVRQLRDIPREQITIVSFGFLPVIRSILKHTEFADCQIIAPAFGAGPEARRKGKIAMLASHGVMPSSHDVVMTDNVIDDADLVAAVDQVVEITADHDSYHYPQPYLPFFYTARIKRTPGFFLKQVLLEELPIVLLAFGLTAMAFNPALWACLTLLFLAMIVSYELGYAENDRVGERKETKPKLTKNYFRFQTYRLLPHAWIFAALLTVVGLLALGAEQRAVAAAHLGLPADVGYWGTIAALSAVWIGVMVAARLVFYAFNHAPLLWRVYIYAPLHIAKYLGFVLLFPVSVVGLLLIYAHIVRTWSLYAVRRAGGDIDFLWSQIVRTLFLLFGLGLIAYVDESTIMSWQTAVIVLFCVLRSVPEMMRKPSQG